MVLSLRRREGNRGKGRAWMLQFGLKKIHNCFHNCCGMVIYVHNLDLENNEQYFNGADVRKWVKSHIYFRKSAQVSTWLSGINSHSFPIEQNE